MVRVSRVLWLNIALHDSAQQRFAALHLQHAAQNLRAERSVDHLLIQHTAVADDQTAVFADIVDFVRDRGKPAAADWYTVCRSPPQNEFRAVPAVQ